MKTNKTLLLLLSAILFLTSCNNDDDDYNVIDTNKVTEVEDFVDERDGKVYKCVKIGNQIWMAENLAYYVPKGQLAGCYIWGEADMDREKLESELGKSIELNFETYYNLYDEAYNMDKGDCTLGVPKAELDNCYYHYWDLQATYYGVEGYNWTIEQSMEYLQQKCPTFWANFDRKLTLLTMTDEEIILARTQEQSDKYADNFKKENGYLYTLDGAKAAVPEGWRIPSDEDWKKLEAALGMSGDLDAINAWRGVNAGDYLKVGGEAKFNAIYAGCNAWQFNKPTSGLYINQDRSAYFWASDESTRLETVTPGEGEDGVLEEEEALVIREGIVRQVSIYSSQIWRGVTRLDGVCYSVRCVKDAN